MGHAEAHGARGADFLSAARGAGHVIAVGVRVAGHAIVIAAKVVGSATGLTDAINCVRNPTLVGCLSMFEPPAT